MNAQTWILRFFLIPLSLVSLIFVVNFLIDPYSMTQYNLFHIPNKFARDDRVEKVAKLKTEARYDTIVFGSSRVYGTNPLMIGHYLGGTAYNAGVGTARVEDFLGFILLLKRLDKLPKNIVIGLDFYSFNEELPPNKYFLKNQDLNFISSKPSSDNYIANFLSIDAFRASIKTVENFISHKSKPRFDENGAAHHASKIFSLDINDTKKLKIYSEAQLLKELAFVKTHQYKKISQKRLKYLKKIVLTCKQNSIKLHLFLTPIYGKLLLKIQEDKELSHVLVLYKKNLSKIAPYSDFMIHNKLIDDSRYFDNLTHMSVIMGNLLYSQMFQKK